MPDGTAFAALHPPPPPPGLLHRLPKWLLCVPLVLHWFWLALRHRSLTLPSSANPRIPTGGLAGEGKLGCLQAIPPRFAPLLAPTVAVPGGCALAAEAARVQAGLPFPLVAKPDVGWCGYGVRRLDTPAALAAYAAAFPRGADLLLQAFVPGPWEAGLMYRRAPGGPGAVVSVTLRHPAPALPGHAPPTVRSLRAGGWYQDAPHLITPALHATVDGMARGMGAHALRLDVRFVSHRALRAGQFTVLEVNGAGAEWVSAWDPALGVWDALGLVFANHRALFALGAAMRARGHRPCGPVALSRAWLRQQRIAQRLPASN